MNLFNAVTKRDLGRFATARGLLVLAAISVAGCGGEPESTRFVPASAASPEGQRAATIDAERDARPARNIATH